MRIDDTQAATHNAVWECAREVHDPQGLPLLGARRERWYVGRRDPMAREAPALPGHHNLPTHATALVGRDREVADLRQLLLSDDGRLVTLTGVGGCGKTRLALGVASSLIGSFKDGVWLVELAALADPLLVPQAVASVLGVRERSDRALLDVLVAHLARRQVLLVLDNCEHLVKACAELADTLLHGCPGVRLLATSREPLHIAGERAWRVPSLAIPDPRAIVPPDELARYSAAQLFVERAQAVQANFGVTPRSAPVLAAICARLEGLPLAIELAAAWVRALGVEQILERLDDAVGLLVGGSRLAPSQQTMRATLDWSYGLLAPPEQIVFRRLAVFVGGWSLEAAEEVCSGSGVAPREVLGLLTGLVDASLVQVDEQDGRARYRLLEPVRQYAQAQLEASGELDAVRHQHVSYFESFAERWEVDANVGGASARGCSRCARTRAGQPTGGAALVSGPGRRVDGVPTLQSALESLGRSRRFQRGPRVAGPVGRPP
jgi:predicted ATPase